MLCQLIRVGLQDQPSPGISVAALCARLGRWGMRGILFLTALVLPTFAASFVRCIKKLMVPCSVLCGTRTRRLFATSWQPFSTWLMTPTKTRPHKPILMLAEWTSEIVSLSVALSHLLLSAVFHDMCNIKRSYCSHRSVSRYRRYHKHVLRSYTKAKLRSSLKLQRLSLRESEFLTSKLSGYSSGHD